VYRVQINIASALTMIPVLHIAYGRAGAAFAGMIAKQA